MDLDREPLEEAGRRAFELFVEIYRGLESRRVEPGEAPLRELTEAVAVTLDEEGVGLLPALEEFARSILPASMATAHPLYLGLVNSSPPPPVAPRRRLLRWRRDAARRAATPLPRHRAG